MGPTTRQENAWHYRTHYSDSHLAHYNMTMLAVSNFLA